RSARLRHFLRYSSDIGGDAVRRTWRDVVRARRAHQQGGGYGLHAGVRVGLHTHSIDARGDREWSERSLLLHREIRRHLEQVGGRLTARDVDERVRHVSETRIDTASLYNRL